MIYYSKIKYNILVKVMKKKILYLISFFIFIILVILLIKKNKVVTSFTPIVSKTIVIDAGHGKPDEGATGLNNTIEQKINLEISRKLQNVIEQSGAMAVITRNTEKGIYNQDMHTIKSKKISDIRNRVKIVNESNANILVSIHLNKYSDSRYKGWQVFYQEKNEESKKLANSIQNSLNLNINCENKREVKPIKNIYLLDHVNIPAVVIECGFISNMEESRELKKDMYQNKIAWGIYFGLQDYFRECSK